MTGATLGMRGTSRKWNVALLAGGKMKTKALTEADRLGELTTWLGKQDVELPTVHVCVDTADEHVHAFAMVLHDNGATVSRVDREAAEGVAAPVTKTAMSPAADATALARYCAANKPEPWIPPPLEERLLMVTLESLSVYRDMRDSEMRHLEGYQREGAEKLAQGVEEHLEWLDGAIARIELEVARLLEAHPYLKDRHAELLQAQD